MPRTCNAHDPDAESTSPGRQRVRSHVATAHRSSLRRRSRAVAHPRPSCMSRGSGSTSRQHLRRPDAPLRAQHLRDRPLDRLHPRRRLKLSACTQFGFELLHGSALGPGHRRLRRAALHLRHPRLVAARALSSPFRSRSASPSFSPSSARAPLRAPISFLTELLAAIPSVVYGLWAVFVLVPIVRDQLGPFLHKYLGWTGLFGGPNFGVGMLTASIILAIMILPIISSLTRDIMRAVPTASAKPCSRSAPRAGR